MSTKRELADAISGFFSTYIPEKRRIRDEKKDEERWQAYYKLQEAAAQRAQEQHQQTMRLMDFQYLQMVENEQDRKDLEKWFTEKHGLTPKQFELEEKVKAAERGDITFQQEQEMFPLKKQFMGAQIGAMERSGRGGGGGGGGDPIGQAIRLAQWEKLMRDLQTPPKFPSVVDYVGQQDPMTAFALQAAQEDLRALDDDIATWARNEPDAWDTEAHAQWQAGLTERMNRQAQARQAYQAIRNSALGINQQSNTGTEQQGANSDGAKPLPEVWGNNVIEQPKGIMERLRDMKRRDMGLPPVDNPVGPPAMTPGVFRPLTVGTPAPTSQPGVTYQLRDPNAVDPNNPFTQFFGPLNVR